MAALARMNRKTPWCLDPDELEQWYNANVQEGTSSFDDDCSEAINKVVRMVHSDALFNVAEIVKGGSLGKGTMIKHFSDVDLIAFINPPDLQSIRELGPQRYKQDHGVVMEHLKKCFIPGRGKNMRGIRFVHPFMATFKISKVGPSRRLLKVDFLPTAVIDMTSCYEDMLSMSDDDRQFYSTSFVKYQVEFVKTIPGNVKELIRMVKYWMYTRFHEKDLRKSYPVELITIHRWESAGKPRTFSKAQGFKDVLQVLTNLSELRVYWKKRYNTSMAIKAIDRLGMKNPIVLDPANPTNNVCKIYHQNQTIRGRVWSNMTRMQRIAERTLRTGLLQKTILKQGWSDTDL